MHAVVSFDVFTNADGEVLVAFDPGASRRARGARGAGIRMGLVKGRPVLRRDDGAAFLLPLSDASVAALRAAGGAAVAETDGRTLFAEYEAKWVG
jgi:hypothetical protein